VRKEGFFFKKKPTLTIPKYLFNAKFHFNGPPAPVVGVAAATFGVFQDKDNILNASASSITKFIDCISSRSADGDGASFYKNKINK
jgi:hypothetical protein